MTLNGVMAVILRYFTEFGKHAFQHNRVDLWRNLCTSLWYFVVRVRCRRKESSCLLSHLLMSFMSTIVEYYTIFPTISFLQSSRRLRRNQKGMHNFLKVPQSKFYVPWLCPGSRKILAPPLRGLRPGSALDPAMGAYSALTDP